MLEDIVKSSHAYLVAKDKNSKYHYCSENFSEILDLESPKQIRGKYDQNLFSKAVADIYRAGDVHVLKGGIMVNVQEIFPHRNELMPVLVTKNQLKDKKDNVIGIIVSFIDMSNLTGSLYKKNSNQLRNNIYEFKINQETIFFTRCEYNVFKNIFFDVSLEEIARKLFISQEMVKNHIKNIKIKLQCTKEKDIIRTAMKYGII